MKCNKMNFDSVVRSHHLHPAGPLSQKRSVDESPENQSRTCSCPAAGGAAGDLLAILENILYNTLKVSSNIS
jgi:hypothetical protein